MLKSLLSRLTGPSDEGSADGERTLALAAAALLLEVAWADHEISDAELARIEAELKRDFALPEEEVAALVAESRQAHEESVGIYSYTRAINEHWSEERKFALVQALWRLALVNDGLHRYEEHTIRKIAELLYLSHSRFIEAKLSARRDVGRGQ
ncbi:MAG TPA: TerB family tellurite resistance protein [Pseudomonadales bacterium]